VATTGCLPHAIALPLKVVILQSEPSQCFSVFLTGVYQHLVQYKWKPFQEYAQLEPVVLFPLLCGKYANLLLSKALLRYGHIVHHHFLHYEVDYTVDEDGDIPEGEYQYHKHQCSLLQEQLHDGSHPSSPY